MKRKLTLKYISSFCFLMSLFLAQAQVTTPKKDTIKQLIPSEISTKNSKKEELKSSKKAVTDTIPVKTNRYGLRVGIDLYKFTRGFYDKNYKGIEFVGDYRLTKKYFLAAEIGNESKTTFDDRLNTTAKGSYLKVGFDYNGYQNWLNMENSISIGLRYGFSTFSQDLNSYKIYNPNPYWGEMPWITSGDKYNNLTASWIEVVAGIKTKVINNLFMGFSLRMSTLVTNQKPDNFDNLYIPGFNKTYNGSFGAGFNYTITYLVPIYKKKVNLKKKAKT